MSLHDKTRSKRASRKLVQDAAERVRVARTLAASFPSAERQAELANAIADFNELNRVEMSGAEAVELGGRPGDVPRATTEAIGADSPRDERGRLRDQP